MSTIQRLFGQDRSPVLGFGLWERLPKEDLGTLLEGATQLRIDRGEPIDSELGIILSGVLGVERELFDGRRVLSMLFHRHELFDLRREDRLRQGQLIALRSAEVLLLNPKAVTQPNGRTSDLSAVIAEQLRRQSARMRDHVTDLASKTPLERLASVLFEFRRWPNQEDHAADPCIVRLPIHRIDIAAYIGVKAETLSRAFKQLERERLVHLSQADQVTLLDAPSLRRIANGGRPRQSTRRAS